MKKRIIISVSLILFAVLLTLYLFKVIMITPLFAGAFSQKGIDVSHYQGHIDWQKIKSQNISFAFIKATEGSSHIDKRFYENRKGADEAEILYGFYHFFSFESSGEKQAKHFIDTVGNLKGCLFPVVDVEYYGKIKPEKQNVIRELNIFLEIVEKEYGVKPIIYSTTVFYNKYLYQNFFSNPLWIRNVYFYSFKDWIFWQYSDKAVLEGYQGKEKYIDMNVFDGSLDELKAYTIKTTQ